MGYETPCWRDGKAAHTRLRGAREWARRGADTPRRAPRVAGARIVPARRWTTCSSARLHAGRCRMRAERGGPIGGAPPGRAYRRRLKTPCGTWLAWARMAVPAWLRI